MAKKDSAETWDRVDPSGQFDLGEAEQVGGTVVNKQPKVENIHSSRAGKKAKHNVNETEE